MDSETKMFAILGIGFVSLLTTMVVGVWGFVAGMVAVAAIALSPK